MLIVKIDTVNQIFETHDGHKSVLEALIEVLDFQDFRWKYQKNEFSIDWYSATKNGST